MKNSAYNKINHSGRDVIIIYKTVEEIRKENTELNQTDFANSIGLSFRSYQERLQGKRKEWKFSEIAKASSYNKNKIRVETEDGVYEATINRVG